MIWRLEEVIERAHLFRDRISDDGRFRVAEGYDEPAKRAGRPFVLLDLGKHVGSFSRQREAIAEAERRAAGLPRSRQRARDEKRSQASIIS